jgi:hypothetical protein
MISAQRKISLGVLLALLALVGISPARADSTPTFYKDPATGCNVGTFGAEPGLSVRWSGPCVKGVAEGLGTVEWQKNGKWLDRSTGNYHSGLRDGQFSFTYPDGGASIGAYHDGLAIPIFYMTPRAVAASGRFRTIRSSASIGAALVRPAKRKVPASPNGKRRASSQAVPKGIFMRAWRRAAACGFMPMAIASRGNITTDKPTAAAS